MPWARLSNLLTRFIDSPETLGRTGNQWHCFKMFQISLTLLNINVIHESSIFINDNATSVWARRCSLNVPCAQELSGAFPVFAALPMTGWQTARPLAQDEVCQFTEFTFSHSDDFWHFRHFWYTKIQNTLRYNKKIEEMWKVFFVTRQPPKCQGWRGASLSHAGRPKSTRTKWKVSGGSDQPGSAALR